MQAEIKMPSFHEVSKALQHVQAIIGASETHGLLCGMICSGSNMSKEAWLNTVFDTLDIESSVDSQEAQLLNSIYSASRWQLRDLNFSFQMLLPDDDNPLYDRAQSLTTWCQGFLCGLGLGGLQIQDSFSADIREGLLHLVDIAKLNLQNIDVCDEDETAYTEVFEYVRTVVFALFDEFSGELANQQIH